MKKILILFAHPALQKSRINRLLIDGVEDLEGVTFHDLYQAYPEFDIDIEAEQRLLEAHDVVVFHHPFFWYSTPAILKEWQDLVLVHGWAFGTHGNALKGKWCFNVLTAGGQEEAYCPKGYNNFTIRELLAPIEQTANLCKMVYLPPFVLHGTHSITTDEVPGYRSEYLSLLKNIQSDRFDVNTIHDLKYLNHFSL